MSTLEIPEAGVRQAVTTDADGYAAIEARASLTLWSPESPKLYRVTLSSEGDTVAERIGFRSIETRGRDILLNGVPVFLRGISIHELARLAGLPWFTAEFGKPALVPRTEPNS